ncbi:LysR family transcriptional regulator [Pseudodonghicola flavimaris]|uniref:LysR family transcriptional regulator n=1 Tax=Pseudodonghicola flavimaris TaxID=3050036 RepID=A0ABT7F520_9RHOB|nr:LysR family transcriptional regulator [Pseudodonghicola flavimaris]MDK3019704.1 LysR family transcriptional regulator [Pseudodonghicola flavimaris]
MNLNLRQLRAFIAGVHAGSFSEAAERIGITQPGFSLLIRQLETELGLRLFDRTTRRVELTPEGREFAGRVQRVLDDLDSACRDLEDMRLMKRGRVRIAILPSAASTILPALARRLSLEAPDLEISITERPADLLQDCVERGDADFGIGPPPDAAPGLSFVPLTTDRLVCICRESDPLAARAEPDWATICGFPLIGFPPGTSIDQQVRALADLHGQPIPRRSEVSGINTAIALVRAGLGFTLIPELALGGLDLSGLNLRAIDSPAARRDVGLIMQRRRTRSPATLTVLDLFQRAGAGVAQEMLSQFRDLERITLPPTRPVPASTPTA